MNLVQEMKTRLAGRQIENDDGREAEIERDQRRTEKQMANREAARRKKLNGFEMPALPERPAEMIELATRRAQLSGDRKAIETELRGVEEKRWQDEQGDVDPLDQAAQRIADGEVDLTTPDAIPEEIETLRRRLDLARRAERKLVTRLAEGNARHNRAIAKALRPQHRAATQRVHTALLELEAANAEEAAVRSAIPGAPLDSFSFPGLGTRGPNGNGALKYWIAYAKRLNMLDESE